MQYDQIKELIQIFEHSDLNNMEVTLGNASVKLGRGMANAVEESPEAQMVQTAVKVENPVTDAAPTTVETAKTEPAAGDRDSSDRRYVLSSKRTGSTTFCEGGGYDCKRRCRMYHRGYEIYE